MRRALYATVLILLGLLSVGGVLWYFAYGLSEPPPTETTVAGLASPAQVQWHEEGLISIRAEDEATTYTALGYAHARQHAWNITMWRRTADGRLAETFGDGLLPIDRLARRLGFAALARETYSQMPEDAQNLLQAYVDGINTALGEGDVQRQEPFALLGLSPDRWEPWHPLALERLFGWLSTTPLTDSTRHIPDSTRAVDTVEPDSLAPLPPTAADSFKTADRLLRRWLHIYGFPQSTAWAVRDDVTTHLFRRIVYGDAAPAFLQEVALHRSDSSVVLGATLPGTPFFLSGQSEDYAWVLLPQSSTTVEEMPRHVLGRPTTFERIRNADDDEFLVRVYRQDGAIPLDEPRPLPADTTMTDSSATSADSVWTLRWAGFRPATDWQAWRALLNGGDAAFQIQDGDGLRVADESWQVTGTPRVAQSFTRGIIVGNSPWTSYVAERLDTLSLRTDSTIDMQAWQSDCVSSWADGIVPALVTAVDSLREPQETSLFEEALVYLRNWDFSYDRASIGASIFDTWVQHYRRGTGQRPAPTTPTDSVDDARARVQHLRSAVDSLRARYGDDLSQWRWERVHRITLAFPVWSADSLIETRSVPARNRYAPIERPGNGHASTLCGGTAPSGFDVTAPAVWEGWSSARGTPYLYVQPRAFNVDRFLDRYRIPTRPPPALHMNPSSQPSGVTTLRPAADR